jgi:hypothetical protein
LLLKRKLRQDFLFDTAKETTKGTVVAVGNGTKEHTMTVKFSSLRKICWVLN